MPTLLATLGLDGKPFEREAKRMERMSTSMAQNMSRGMSGAFGGLTSRLAGVFSIAGIGKLSHDTIKWAGNLRDVSDELGVNVEWLQKMQNGAKVAGGDIEDIAKFIGEMNKSREDAIKNPKGKNAQAFERLGATQSDISGLSTQAFFQKMVDAFKNGATTQGVNDIQEVGGKSARQLIAAFSSQFASDAPILAESVVDQLDEVDDAFADLATQLKVNLAPAIVWVADKLKGLINLPKQSGAGMGQAFVDVKGKMQEQAQAGVPRWKRTLNYWPEWFKSYQHGVVSEEADQQNQADGANIAKKTERTARRARENAPPNFAPLEEKEKAEKDKPQRDKPRNQSADVNEMQRSGHWGTSAGNNSLEKINQQMDNKLGLILKELQKGGKGNKDINKNFGGGGGGAK